MPKFTVKDKEQRKLNYSYWEADDSKFTYTTLRRPEEQESFSQPHFELLNEYKYSSNLTFNSALFLVLGSGYFDYDGSWGSYEYFRLTPGNGFPVTTVPAESFFSNALIRAQVENKQFGWLPRINWKLESVEINAGAEIRHHQSLHWGSLIYGTGLIDALTPEYRYYYYEASKDMIGAFINSNFKLDEKTHLLTELQLSYTKYHLFNEKYIGTDFTVKKLFLNPKVALNYSFDSEQSSYISVAYVSKEPRLKNYYYADEASGGEVPQFEQRTDGSYDFTKPLVKPESMLDLELGYLYNTKNLNVSLSGFVMSFSHEIVNNGQVDKFGNPLTGNIDRTLHRGLELAARYQFENGFWCNVNATYSRNSIGKGTSFVTYNDPLTSSKALAAIDMSGNRIGGFPDFLTNFTLGYNKNDLVLQVTGAYVGAFYSDNYDTNIKNYLALYPGFINYADNKNDAYFTLNFYGSYETPLGGLDSKIRFFFQINNVFNKLYSANAIGDEFFPAAEINFHGGISLTF